MKQKIRLTENELKQIVAESVKNILKENNNFTYVMDNCKHDLNSVISKFGDKIRNLYELLTDAKSYNDKELYRQARKLYNTIISYDLKYSLPFEIWNALNPIVTDYINSHKNSLNNDFDEPEDWYERNEHGDFDTHY